MELCSAAHDEIVHESSECPLCDLISKVDDFENCKPSRELKRMMTDIGDLDDAPGLEIKTLTQLLTFIAGRLETGDVTIPDVVFVPRLTWTKLTQYVNAAGEFITEIDDLDLSV